MVKSSINILKPVVFLLGTVPNDWREAIVTPVFKKGAKSKPENYRPWKCSDSVVLFGIVPTVWYCLELFRQCGIV
jgi:hypothetical protein